MILFPNAKINLGLYITEKRSDGFHNLSTCFYPVPWSDILEITPHDTFEFSTSGLAISGALETNLCYRAFMLLKEAFNIAPVHIHLHKVIPMGAGLGGGSSDAAYTLMGLRDMFKLPLTNEDLIPFAQKLGSDCAFFLFNQAQIGTEKGDVLTPLDLSLTGKFLVMIYPNFGISTQEAYAGVKPKKARKNWEKQFTKPLETWKEPISNDFENSLFPAYPQLAEIKNELYAIGAQYAAMSGSGSTIFGLFDQEVKLPESWKAFQTWSGLLP
ncbi:4-(cytidine 5'-diphospho)-2-C-methyl-D-erythritol kinase [Aquirufa regiilacus]